MTEIESKVQAEEQSAEETFKSKSDHASSKIEQQNQSWITSKWRINKNLVVIGLSWMCLFTAFQSIANLQSSLNSQAGVGTASLSAIYITLVLSCLFLPSLMIKNLGLKWTIVLSQICYLMYIAANMLPRWYILIPGKILLKSFFTCSGKKISFN